MAASASRTPSAATLGADVDADADVDVNADVVAIVGVVVVAVVMTAEDVDAAAGCPSCALLALVNNCAIFMWISRRVHHFFYIRCISNTLWWFGLH